MIAIGATLTCTPTIASSQCDAVYDAYVGYIEKCGGLLATTNMLDANVYDIFDARADFVDHYCNNLGSAPGTSNLATELAACAAALTQSSCFSSAVISACALRGTLPAGSPCGFHEQCASGWCDVEPAQGKDFQCGSCSSLVQVGAACSAASNDVCVGDAYCTTIGVGVCTTFAHVGDPCDSSKDLRCESGTVCDDYGSHTCVRAGQSGQPCTQLTQAAPVCELGNTCVNGTCTPVSITGMQPLPTCVEYCSAGGVADASFTACTCPKGSFCSGGENGACLPEAQVGQPCDGSLNRCGASLASGGHNPWLACVNGVCQEPDLSSCH